MSAWTFADVWEAIAAVQPDHPAFIQGERVVTWGQFDARADALAAHLIAAGLDRQAKVAAFLYNGPEYIESYYAAFKARLRAGEHQLPLRAGRALLPVRQRRRRRPWCSTPASPRCWRRSAAGLPGVKAWIAVAEPGHPVPAWADDYDAIVAKVPAQRPVKAPWGRSGDDLLLLYTGGTTGMPKGVMWAQDDLFNVIGAGGNALLGIPPATSIDELVARITVAGAPAADDADRLPADARHRPVLEPDLLQRTAARRPTCRRASSTPWSCGTRSTGCGASNIVIVGLAFSTPMLEALEANPGPLGPVDASGR